MFYLYIMSVEMRRKASTLKLSNQKSAIGFSLNNPRRVGAHTGEPQTQTPFRGTGARGTMPGPHVINQSQYICADLFNVPHPSVKNTRGYLSTKNKWLNRTYPYSVVKNTDSSYDMYLHKIKGEVAKKAVTVDSGTCVCTKNAVGNYHKDILKMNYTIYYQSNIFKKECIPLPPSKAHYPPQNMSPVSFCTPALSLQEFMDKQC